MSEPPKRRNDWERLRRGLGELSVRPLPRILAVPDPVAAPPAVKTGFDHRYGLVLAGGAAKGAYQVGVVECLVHNGIRPHALAGTSIGALNGVILASSPSPEEGVARLVDLWSTLTGLFGEDTGETEDGLWSRVLRLLGTRGDLERLIEEAIDEEAMRTGVPMRVAAFPVLPPLPALAQLLPVKHRMAFEILRQSYNWLGRYFGAKGDILQLNGMSRAEIKDAVLASAALPVLFPARSLQGRYYRDGMLAGDNTPIRALAREDGCDIVVVVHLTPGEPVRPEDEESVTLLRIHPPRDLAGGTLKGLLNFTPSNFRRLREQGYADTERILDEYRSLLRSRDHVASAQSFMADRVQRVLDEYRRLWPGEDRLPG